MSRCWRCLVFVAWFCRTTTISLKTRCSQGQGFQNQMNIFILTDVRLLAIACIPNGLRVKSALHLHFRLALCIYPRPCSILGVFLGSRDGFRKRRLRVVRTTPGTEFQNSTENLPEGKRVTVLDVAEETRGAVTTSSGIMLNTGRFSWLTQRLWKRKIADCAGYPEVQYSTKNLPEVERVIRLVVVEETRDTVTIYNGESSGDNRAAVPTTTEYLTAAVKNVLTLLQSVSTVIPVPLLKESCQVASKVIELYEGASAVGGGAERYHHESHDHRRRSCKVPKPRRR